jgi:hypothetical protein
MADTVFSISERERDAITSCLKSLDQARINLEIRDGRHGKDDEIVRELEHCHDGIRDVVNALQRRTSAR